ncbi:MAG: DUF4391 domain-containing protein [Caldilineaceae bacterium]|nr:DUF4391 domain-containing protein [Caldilineaceae bacterium]
MKPFNPVAALALPDGALVDRRVPKTMLVEHGARTAADRRSIREGIEETRWLATLKSTTIGVAEYRDAGREYIEIAVLKLTLRRDAKAERLTELLHRAVPYPVLLFSCQEDTFVMSLAHKRWSQAEKGKTVLDGGVVATPDWNDQQHETIKSFSEALAIGSQPLTSLYSLYQGWIDAVRTLRAAMVTGEFLLPASSVGAEARAAALLEYNILESRIAELRVAARKENQIARRAEMNLELRRLRTDREEILTRL